MITYLMREDGDIICSQMYVEMFCRELCNYLNFNERIYEYDFDVIVLFALLWQNTFYQEYNWQ